MIARAPARGRAEGCARCSRSVFEDKVRGGWAGQMIGVSFGAPTEFRSNGKIIDWRPPAWTPEPCRERDQPGRPLRRDDVRRSDGHRRPGRHERAVRRHVQALEVRAVARQRLGPPPARTTASRRRSRAIRSYNAHANDIDFQIESDFIGLMTPGLPQEANRYCRPRRPRHELRRRPLRRHVLRRHVRGRVLRERPAQGRRGRPAADPGGQRLRERSSATC